MVSAVRSVRGNCEGKRLMIERLLCHDLKQDPLEELCHAITARNHF